MKPPPPAPEDWGGGRDGAESERITGARGSSTCIYVYIKAGINPNAGSAANYGKPTREETEKRIESRSP